MTSNNSTVDEMVKYTQGLYAKEKGINYIEYLKKAYGQNFYREILTGTALATDQGLSHRTEILYKEEFDSIVNLCASLLREQIDIPDNLAIFLADFLEGKRARPTKKIPVINPISVSDEDYFFLAKDLNKRFNIPLYNSEHTNSTTAADIIAQALGRSVETIKKSIKKINSYIRQS